MNIGNFFQAKGNVINNVRLLLIVGIVGGDLVIIRDLFNNFSSLLNIILPFKLNYIDRFYSEINKPKFQSLR